LLVLYDDSDKPIATLSTSYFNGAAYRRLWSGEYYESARPLKIEVGFRNYMTSKPPIEYIALQQPVWSELRWKDDTQQLFGGAGYHWVYHRWTQGIPKVYIAPGVLEADSQAEPTEDAAFKDAFKLPEEVYRKHWQEELEALYGPYDPFDRATTPDSQWEERLLFAGSEFETGGDWGVPMPGQKFYSGLSRAFGEFNFLRKVQETDKVGPNDPLFVKEESKAKKAASGLKKGIGSILKRGGSGGVSIGGSAGESPKPPNQWGLLKVGYTPRSDSQSAWNIEDGSRKNVVVAVIDSGLDLTHMDGPEFLWTNAGEIPDNNIDDDANGYVDDIHGWNFVDENNDITDYYGHGTFVTGIIAAKTNNGEGIAGINPGAQIMTLKAANKEGTARSLAIYRAIRYAVDNGARVINISLGAKGISRLEQIAVNYAHAQDCLVVISSGNQGGDVAEYGPPGARRAFSVAAIDVDGKRRGTANYGANVALTAPGEHIYSLTAKEGKADGRITPILPTKYHTLTGTSFSAPFVAGTASLIWAKYPHSTNRQVEDMLLNSAEDLDRKGWDRYNGAGLLNASKALGGGTQDRLTVRFTEVFANKKKTKIGSLDVYGIVRGNLDSYVVELGKGRKPKKWQQVFGPSDKPAEYSHICRIEDKLLRKGREWTVRLVAKSKRGETKTASFLVRKK
jgi:subtilisin family serine protease